LDSNGDDRCKRIRAITEMTKQSPFPKVSLCGVYLLDVGVKLIYTDCPSMIKLRLMTNNRYIYFTMSLIFMTISLTYT